MSNRRAAYPAEQANKNGARNKFKHLGLSPLTLNRTTHQVVADYFFSGKIQRICKERKINAIRPQNNYPHASPGNNPRTSR